MDHLLKSEIKMVPRSRQTKIMEYIHIHVRRSFRDLGFVSSKPTGEQPVDNDHEGKYN